MRTLKVAGKVALLAVVLVILGGCCDEQKRDIARLRIDNGELRRLLLDEQKKTEVLNERLASYQNDGSRLNEVIRSRDQTIAGLNDRIAALEQSLRDRNAAYEALVGKLSGPPVVGGPLPAGTAQLLKALQANYPGMLEFDEASGQLKFASDLTFDLGKADLKPGAVDALKQLAGILNQDEAKPIRVDVIGHTCNTPLVKPATIAEFKNNQGLSEARARAVSSILIQQGVDVGRIHNKGMGDTQPLVPNTSKENKARNRRVEVYLSMPAGAVAP